MPRAYSYEQAMAVIREIVTESVNADLEQLFRRAVFNVVGRNQDDHTKNIAFLMNKEGKWCISPVYDVTYSYNPKGQWTSQHQMLLNGKADGFSKEDLIALAKHADIKKTKALQIVAEVLAVFLKWESYAQKAAVFEEHILEIKKYLRLSFE